MKQLCLLFYFELFIKSKMRILWVIILAIVSSTFEQASPYPEQVHLSLTSSPGEILVTWVTFVKQVGVLKYSSQLCNIRKTAVFAEYKKFEAGKNNT
jgi:hypothetical protein